MLEPVPERFISVDLAGAVRGRFYLLDLIQFKSYAPPPSLVLSGLDLPDSGRSAPVVFYFLLFLLTSKIKTASVVAFSFQGIWIFLSNLDERLDFKLD